MWKRLGLDEPHYYTGKPHYIVLDLLIQVLSLLIEACFVFILLLVSVVLLPYRLAVVMTAGYRERNNILCGTCGKILLMTGECNNLLCGDSIHQR